MQRKCLHYKLFLYRLVLKIVDDCGLHFMNWNNVVHHTLNPNIETQHCLKTYVSPLVKEFCHLYKNFILLHLYQRQSNFFFLLCFMVKSSRPIYITCVLPYNVISFFFISSASHCDIIRCVYGPAASHPSLPW